MSLARIAAAAVTGASVLFAGLLAPQLASAAPASCAENKNCKVVAHTDMDGDGRVETVSVTARKVSNGYPRAATVKVLTGKGKRVSYKIDHISGVRADDLFRARALIDGRKGTELLIFTTAGAHTNYYRVITYKGGKLQTVRAPKLPKKTGASTSTLNWFTDGAARSVAGIYRDSNKGRTEVTLKVATANETNNRFTGYVVDYVWRDGGWDRTSINKRSWSNKAAHKIDGWHSGQLHGMSALR